VCGRDPEVLEPDFEDNIGLYALGTSQVMGIVAWELGFYAL
jgi:hypothetical protein